MTNSFAARVEAFDANMEFQAPYAEEIRQFMRGVIARLARGQPLLSEQESLLYTDDMAAFSRALAEWADTVEASAPRLRRTLAQGRVYEAVQHAISWPNGQSRLYETVLDIYKFERNPLLRNPDEASAAARAKLEAVFPINVNAEDPLEGRADEFASQLDRYGNPWV